MFFVYVIKSTVDNRLYKGLTIDLEKRVKEHNFGKTKSTSPYKPWILVYCEKFNSRDEARKREKCLKSGVGREFLKNKLNL